MKPGLELLLFCMAVVLFNRSTSVFGINIRFFEGENNTGSYHDVDEAYHFKGGCTNLLYRYMPLKGSVRTDTCLMVFTEESCKLYSGKVLAGSSSNIRELFLFPYREDTYSRDEYFGARSFRPCTKSEGGPQLNVDVFETNGPKFEYRNICGCRNLAKVLNYKTASVKADNYGNSFKVYTEDNCGGKSQVIPAGYSRYSRDLSNFKQTDPSPDYHAIRSIGPDRDSPSFKECMQLTSSVFEFEFLESESGDRDVTKDVVELTQKTFFKNDGTAKITHEYKVGKKVTETYDISVAKGYSGVHKTVVEDTFKIEGGANIPFLTKGKIRNELKFAYENQQSSTDTETERNSTSTSREISIRQLIEVPACTEYVVSSFVVMLKDKPFEYKVHSKITGERGDERMTTDKIREYLAGTDIEFLEDVDEYTVHVAAKAEVKATYGIEATVDGEGKKIPGCGLEK